MTSNTSFNTGTHLHRLMMICFSCENLDLKSSFKILILNYGKKVINGLFIPTQYVNGKVVDKPDFLWPKEDKRKLTINFKAKHFFVNEIQFLHVFNCQSAKKMWSTLEMIYKVSPRIKLKGMNTRGEEDECECFFHKVFSTFRYLGSHVRTFGANKYTRVNNWNKFFDQILKSRDENIYNF